MNIQDFFKKQLINFFIISTCIAAAMAVLGQVLLPEASFGYEALLAPLAYGFLCTLPAIVLYSPKELPLRQLLVRKVLHKLLIMAALAGVMAYLGLRDPLTYLALLLSVLVISGIVEGLNWLQNSREAKTLNQQLEQLRRQTDAIG